MSTKSFSCLLLLHFFLCLTDDRCQMTMVNGKGRKEHHRMLLSPKIWSFLFTSCVTPSMNMRGFHWSILNLGNLSRTSVSLNALIPSSLCVFLSLCLCLSPSGSVSLSVFLVSVAFIVCAVWLVALCGVCTWCQRKLVSDSASLSHFYKRISKWTLKKKCFREICQSNCTHWPTVPLRQFIKRL